MTLLRPLLSLAEAEAPRETRAESMSASAKVLGPARSGDLAAELRAPASFSIRQRPACMPPSACYIVLDDEIEQTPGRCPLLSCSTPHHPRTPDTWKKEHRRASLSVSALD